jgi:hypothetical protein
MREIRVKFLALSSEVAIGLVGCVEVDGLR